MRLPMGLIPNGSGNDFNSSFGVVRTNLDLALDYIIKGDTMKIDIIKCLVDYENFEEIPEDKVFTNFRYIICGLTSGLVAKLVHRAQRYKTNFCGDPYILAAAVELLSSQTESYTVEVDGVKVVENF